MFPNLSPDTRILLVLSRAYAMKGNLAEALRRLDAAVQSPNTLSAADNVALLTLKAELLFLDYQNERALEIFRGQIAPLLCSLPREMALAIEYNQNDVECAVLTLDSLSEFYRLYDWRRLLGVEYSDHASIVEAYQAAAEGKHYDALPAFWLDWLENFHRGCWRFQKQSANRLAEEFQSLGWVVAACYYAILSGDDDRAKAIADQLLSSRNTEAIKESLHKLLATANLNMHTRTACWLIRNVADGIPDSQITDVTEWLLDKSTRALDDLRTLSLHQNIWQALEAIAFRLNTELAQKVIKTAVQHQCWKIPNKLRSYLINTVNACLPLLPVSEMDEMAQVSIPLAVEQKDDLDYREALNLLCHIAEQGEAKAKARIGNALYPTSTLGNKFLTQISPLFGRKIIRTETTGQAILSTIEDIRLQVQRHKPDEPNKKVNGSFGQFSLIGDKDAISISIGGNGIEELIPHRNILLPDEVEAVVDAALAMVTEAENIPANKVSLLISIADLADLLTPALADKIFVAVSPLALGQFLPSHYDVESAADPLNPFKVNLGKLSEVRGAAIRSLTIIEETRKGVFGEKLDIIFEKAITDIDPQVRLYALNAARRMATLSAPALTGVLMGTRDPNLNIVAAAFAVLATNKRLALSEVLRDLLMGSLTLACDSHSVAVRRTAAHAVKNLLLAIGDENVDGRLQHLKARLAKDICYSVRQVFRADKAVNLIEPSLNQGQNTAGDEADDKEDSPNDKE